MKNNKEKIDALIKKYFNVEYYNLKNRIESSLDEIAKSDNATKNFETNIIVKSLIQKIILMM